MANSLTHLDESGKASMVDVGNKAASVRIARAEGLIAMKPETLDLIRHHQHKKGDVLGVARIAAIMSSKRCAELIPLCHPINLDQVTVDFEFLRERSAIKIAVTTKAQDKTGVEMEALTAVCIGLLTLYDMCKSTDRGMQIEAIHLSEKSGGRSGFWRVGDLV